MARLFSTASSHKLEYAGAALTAVPLTFACWFYPLDITTNYCLMSIGSTTSTSDFRLDIKAGGSGARVNAIAQAPAANGVSESTNAYIANTWQHAAATFTSTTSRSSFLNGIGKGTDTTSVTPASLNRTDIGVAIYNNSPFAYMNGRIARAAMWNVVLTDSQILWLAQSRSRDPRRIPNGPRPHAYWSLDGGLAIEPELMKRAYNLTITGTAVVQKEPIWKKTRQRRFAFSELEPDMPDFLFHRSPEPVRRKRSMIAY